MSLSKTLQPLTSSYILRFLRSQLLTKAKVPPQDTDLTGQVAIVTGSNTGLGLEASDQLLSYKLSRLIMAVRSTQRGEAAAAKLRRKHPGAIIDVWLLDMSSYGSIQKFAKRVEEELSRLDIAVLNAGIAKLEYTANPETKHEETIQVNYLSTMLLGILLLPSLKKKSPPSTPGRLNIVSSALANVAVLPDHTERSILSALDNPHNFGRPQYGISKLIGHLFLWKLEEYVSAEDVIYNFVEPGFMKGTDLHRDVKGATAIPMSLFIGAVGRPVKDAAKIILDATITKGKESHGCYMADWEIRPFPPFLYTQEGRNTVDKLWIETMNELSFAKVEDILTSIKKA